MSSYKKFILQLKESFRSNELQKTRKKESIERLLAKLRSKKETFKSIAKETLGKKDLAELKENLAIITLQIKKSEAVLGKLGT